MNQNNTITLDAVRSVMFGHAIADALGVPVEFEDRQTLRAQPVTDYRAFGTHHVPAGTWSDDTSMALATLDSLNRGLDPEDIMTRFSNWKLRADYTATGVVFDMGLTTQQALHQFQCGTPAVQCGLRGEFDNGNGSIMRIHPVVLYAAARKMTAAETAALCHQISGLTHAHARSKMGCGIFSFVLTALLQSRSRDCVLPALQEAKAFYQNEGQTREMTTYQRIFSPEFAATAEDDINTSGYVVSTLEAAVWCLLNTDNYADCVLKAVNLGSDTDTVAAVAGALAGALYGMEAIPRKWYDGLLKKEDIETLCSCFAEKWL